MTPFRLVNILTLATLLPLAGQSAADDFRWPEGQALAVSLSYDDALDSQLDYALAALDDYELKASFYPTLTSPVIAERLDEWRAAAANGHELGNHSVFHACSKSEPGMDWVPDDNDLDQRTVAQMVSEIAVANAFLHAIDSRTERTMTPPCGHEQARDGNYIDAVRDEFVAIKFSERGLPDDFSTLVVPSGVSGEELISMVSAAKAEHRMINVIFHGVGGDHLSVSGDAHRQLLAYLAQNPSEYWTDSYLTIMQHVRDFYPR